MKIEKFQNNVVFSKLYMPPKEKIEKQMGKYAALEAEKARPTLEKFAEDYDIILSLSGAKGLLYSDINIIVRELSSSKWDFLFKKLCKVKERIEGYEF